MRNLDAAIGSLNRVTGRIDKHIVCAKVLNVDAVVVIGRVNVIAYA